MKVRYPVDIEPSVVPVGTLDAILSSEWPRRAGGFHEIPLRPLAILGMQHLDPPESESLFRIAAAIFTPVMADIRGATLCVGRPDDHGSAFGKCSKAQFALTQSILRPSTADCRGGLLFQRGNGLRHLPERACRSCGNARLLSVGPRHK